MLNNSQREAAIKQLIELLRDKRLQKKLSVNEVAVRSGLSRAMISRVEKGERLPTIDTLLRISEALEIDLARLLRKAVNSVKASIPAAKGRKGM